MEKVYKEKTNQLEKEKLKSQQELDDMVRSYNELMDANNVIEEDNKSYIEKISNMGEKLVEKSKLKDLRKSLQQQE